MHRRWLLTGSVVGLAVPARASAGWMLVSDSDVARDRAAPVSMVPRTVADMAGAAGPPGAPQIVVDLPQVAPTLQPPLSFRLRFVCAPGAAIVPGSFKVCYGALGIDITDRLLRHARLSAQGLAADGINIPAGSHKVAMTVDDTLGREGSRIFRFTIG